MNRQPLTIALPKGRLLAPLQRHLADSDISVSFETRQLVSSAGGNRFILVKNSDLPTYVEHGIAGLGICGFDTLFESGRELLQLMQLPIAAATLCLCCHRDHQRNGSDNHLIVATQYNRLTRRYFHQKGIATKIIHLNGSVELAPLLGLCHYIVDIVETGATLRANNLIIVEEIDKIGVFLIANPAYYKFYHKQVDAFMKQIDIGSSNK